MFQNLTEKLEKSFKVLKGHGRINEINVAQTLKEIRRAQLILMLLIKLQKNLLTRSKIRQWVKKS